MQCLKKGCDGHYEPICTTCEVPKWIKCTERLPIIEDYRKAFIVYGSPSCGSHSSDFCVMEAYYHKDGYFEFGEYDCSILVTHWMKLPEPPKE